MPRESLQCEDVPSDDSAPSSTMPKAGESSATLVPSESEPGRKRPNLAIPLAILIGIVGATIGYVAEKPKYRSTALLRVNPVLPKVLFDTDQSAPMPMYDSYVQTQCALIESRRVVDMAIQRNVSKQFDYAYSYDQAHKFANNLRATRIKGTELIQVAFTDETPVLAQIGAESVVEAYMQVYGQNDGSEEMIRFDILESREKLLEEQIASLQERELSVGGEFGQLAPGKLYDAEVERLLSLENSMKEARFEMKTTVQSISEKDREAVEKRHEIKLKSLQESYDESRDKLVHLGKSALEIEGLRADLSRERNSLAQTQARLDELKLESVLRGRISPLNGAELPTDISNRRDKTMLSSLGGLVGAILGLALGMYWKKSRNPV